MDVTVDQPGNDEAPRQVDPAGGRGLRRQSVMRPDRDDTLALDQYVLIGTRRAAGAVDDRRAGLERGLGGVGGDRKSVVSGKRVSVRVDLRGRRFIKKKKRD